MNASEALSALKSGVEALRTSDDWTRYLTQRAKFHQYSVGNVLLILFQRPDATQVAGYNRWLDLKRYVKKGEKGIAILAPVITKKETAEGEAKIVRYFKTVYVFDVAQTDGEPLAELPIEQLGTAQRQDLLDALHTEARGMGLQIEEREMSDNYGGFYVPGGANLIVLNSVHSVDQKAKTLIHEMAHHILHGERGNKTSETMRELEAETAAYLACAQLGLDSASYSFGYLAAYLQEEKHDLLDVARQSDVAVKRILESLATATLISLPIIKQVEVEVTA